MSALQRGRVALVGAVDAEDLAKLDGGHRTPQRVMATAREREQRHRDHRPQDELAPGRDRHQWRLRNRNEPAARTAATASRVSSTAIPRPATTPPAAVIRSLSRS